MNSPSSNQMIADLTPRRKTTSMALVGTALGLSIFSIWVISDYYAWLALGTGGSLPNLSGYWRMTKRRVHFALSDVDFRDSSSLSTEGPSYIDDHLPVRQGPRPKSISRTMPQRQVPVPLDPAVLQRLHDLAKNYAAKHPGLLILDKSKVEGRTTDAIYAQPGLPGRSPSAVDEDLGDEIAHAHHADNSLHVWLSEPDAKRVIDAGWGERFPLSCLGFVHKGLTFVYAPRSMADVDVIERIVKGGIGYLTGQRI